MQISELSEITASELRDQMYIVVEDETTTYKINLGEFKKWMVAQSKEQTRGYINESIDKVVNALKDVKLLPDVLKFIGNPEMKKEEEDPYGFFQIKYTQPEKETYNFTVTNLTTGTEVFRTVIENEGPAEEGLFRWNLRSYDAINKLSDEEKETAGFLFYKGKYVYRNIDANNTNILLIENNNDNIITVGTQLLLEISTESFERIKAIYTVTSEDVIAATKQ